MTSSGTYKAILILDIYLVFTYEKMELVNMTCLNFN